VTTTTSIPLASSSRRTAVYGLAGLAVSLVVVLLGNWHVESGEQGGAGPALFCSVFCLLVAALLFGLVVPRARRLDRTTVVLGVVALLSLAVFWAGVTPVIAAAALAARARSSEPSRGATVWSVIAAISALLVVAWTLANAHLF
jgi:hypothetical protein